MKRARRPSPQTLPAPLGRALLNLAALAALGGAALPVAAQAIEYRSVGAAALLRAQPATDAEALYRLRPGTPVEIVVREDGWLRVRDPEGGLAWVEGSALSTRRMVIVTAERALVRRAPAESAAPAFEATRHVVLELLEPASQGWARVRHVEGFEGFVRAGEVWGL